MIDLGKSTFLWNTPLVLGGNPSAIADKLIEGKNGVYCIRSLVNGHRYVGSAASLKARAACHWSNLKARRHDNIHLQRAYDKHGRDALVFEPLLYCDQESLRFFEQRAIDAC